MSSNRLTDADKREIVSIARQILSGELGLLEGCKKMNSASAGKDEWYEEPLIVFMGVSGQTDDLPIGELRRLSTADSLIEKDREIKSAEEFFRTSVHEACRKIIAEFSGDASGQDEGRSA